MNCTFDNLPSRLSRSFKVMETDTDRSAPYDPSSTISEIKNDIGRKAHKKDYLSSGV